MFVVHVYTCCFLCGIIGCEFLAVIILDPARETHKVKHILSALAILILNVICVSIGSVLNYGGIVAVVVAIFILAAS